MTHLQGVHISILLPRFTCPNDDGWKPCWNTHKRINDNYCNECFTSEYLAEEEGLLVFFVIKLFDDNIFNDATNTLNSQDEFPSWFW